MCDDTLLKKNLDEPTSSVQKYLTELAKNYGKEDVNEIIQLCQPEEIENIYKKGYDDDSHFNFFCLDISGLDASNKNKRYIMLILFHKYTDVLLDVDITEINNIQTNINIPTFFKINNSKNEDDELNEVNFEDNLLLFEIFIGRLFENFLKRFNVFINEDSIDYKNFINLKYFLTVIKRKILSFRIYIKNFDVESNLIPNFKSIETSFEILHLMFKIIFYKYYTDIESQIQDFKLYDISFKNQLQSCTKNIISITRNLEKKRRFKELFFITFISLFKERIDIEFLPLKDNLIKKMKKYENIEEYKFIINKLFEISKKDSLDKKILEDKLIVENFLQDDKKYNDNLTNDLQNSLKIPDDKDYKFFNITGEIIKEYTKYYNFSDNYKKILNEISDNYLGRLSDEALFKEFDKPIVKSKKKKKIGGGGGGGIKEEDISDLSAIDESYHNKLFEGAESIEISSEKKLPDSIEDVRIKIRKEFFKEDNIVFDEVDYNKIYSKKRDYIPKKLYDTIVFNYLKDYLVYVFSYATSTFPHLRKEENIIAGHLFLQGGACFQYYSNKKRRTYDLDYSFILDSFKKSDDSESLFIYQKDFFIKYIFPFILSIDVKKILEKDFIFKGNELNVFEENMKDEILKFLNSLRESDLRFIFKYDKKRGIFNIGIKYQIKSYTFETNLVDISLFNKDDKKKDSMIKEINKSLGSSSNSPKLQTINISKGLYIYLLQKEYLVAQANKYKEEYEKFKLHTGDTPFVNKYISEVSGIKLEDTIKFLGEKAIDQLNSLDVEEKSEKSSDGKRLRRKNKIILVRKRF